MRVILLAAALVLAPLPALAQYDKTPPPPPPPKPVPRATVMSGPAAAQSHFDVPREEMTASLKEIDAGDWKGAGGDLEDLIRALQAAADTSQTEAIKANVLRSVIELENKAGRLKSGTSASPVELMAMFSRALQALSEHHATLAQSHLTSGAPVASGQDLRAAVLNANQAVVWGNVKLADAETNRLNVAGRTAKSLIEQKTVDKVTTEKTLADLRDWVHELRARLPKAGT